MKRIVLTGNSAVEFWRGNRIADTLPVHDAMLGDEPLQRADISDSRLERYGIDTGSLHLLVGTASARRCYKGVKSSVRSTPLPLGALRMTPDGIFIVSPELCFVHVAAERGLLGAVSYGYEICGSYSLGVLDRDDITFDRPPPASVESLARHVEDDSGAPGAGIARHALRFIVGHSASPMETAVVMLLCMPRKYGGYALPFPAMNERFDLDPADRKVTRNAHFRFDLFWPEHHLVVEYNSDYAHDNDRSVHRDAFRNNIITAQGNTVFVLTWDSVWKAELFDRMAHVLAARMGKRIRSDIDQAKFVDARKRLRECVMPSLRRR